MEVLDGYKAEKEKQVEALTQQRTGLKNELKRHIREEQKGSDIPVPDRSTTEKDKEEAFLDALLTPAPNKEEAQTQNPTQGPAAKSRPSEPTSNQREKTVRGISDPTERSRPSVRQEMKEIREEQRQRTSSAQKSKDEPNRTSEHRPVPKKKKDKER